MRAFKTEFLRNFKLQYSINVRDTIDEKMQKCLRVHQVQVETTKKKYQQQHHSNLRYA